MSDEVKQAAERLRKQQIRGGGFVTTDEDQWIQDVCRLANAYLASYPADDGEARKQLERIKAEYDGRPGPLWEATVDAMPLPYWLEAQAFLCRQMMMNRTDDELWYRVYEYQKLAYERVLEKLKHPTASDQEANKPCA